MAKKKRMTKKRRIKRRIVTVFILLVLIVVGVTVGPMAVRLIKGYNSLQRTENIDSKDAGINEDLNSKFIDEYTNIAVFGVDSRDNNLERGLSDMIMIVSINNKTKDIKVASVYRDSYLMWKEENGKMKFRKATEVYNQGGYEMSLKMLNTNFDLNITDFITVNFEAVYMAIDAVGGVEIDVSKSEAFGGGEGHMLNDYIDELNRINKTKAKHITKAGVQTLNGIQATAYGRIRYMDSDYNRAERQRKVLMALFEKVKDSSFNDLSKLIEQLSPKILTSLSDKEILSLAKDVSGYKIADQTGFPFEQTVVHHSSKGDIVVADNLTLSVKQLHEYLFGDEDYEPSAKVKSISKALDKDLGRQENTKTTMHSSSAAEDSKKEATKAESETYTKKR